MLLYLRILPTSLLCLFFLVVAFVIIILYRQVLHCYVEVKDLLRRRLLSLLIPIVIGLLLLLLLLLVIGTAHITILFGLVTIINFDTLTTLAELEFDVLKHIRVLIDR